MTSQAKIAKIKEEFNREFPHSTLIKRTEITKYFDKFASVINTSLKNIEPDEVKRGDVVLFRFGGVAHPAILLNKDEQHWRCLMLTTDPRFGFREITSRFFKGYYSTFIGVVHENSVKSLFINRFDNIKEFNTIMKDIRKFYSNI